MNKYRYKFNFSSTYENMSWLNFSQITFLMFGCFTKQGLITLLKVQERALWIKYNNQLATNISQLS